MQLITVLSLLSAAASLGAAAPTLSARYDPTICAPGTGYYQVCSSGYKGCCTKDACTLGYCPGTAPPPSEPSELPKQPPAELPKEPPATLPPGTCAAGTGNYYVCASGFKGCCLQDACTLGYCPGKPAEPEKPKPTEPEKPKTLPEGQCAAGTGYYQVCGNGYKGCCTKDACSLGYCPL